MKSGTGFNWRAAFVRAVLVAGGLNYALTGLALLFASEWFYQNIGYFPPFNRHYAGDLGGFTLPIGVALLWAARKPEQHRLMIGYAAFASLIHALNHGYDDLQAGLSVTGWLTSQTAVLLVFAAMLVAAWWMVGRALSVKR